MAPGHRTVAIRSGYGHSWSIICKYLVLYIKEIRTGDPNESDLTYWMFSYDFKTNNKEWFPEEKNLLTRKRRRNFLIFILYINVFLICLMELLYVS